MRYLLHFLIIVIPYMTFAQEKEQNHDFTESIEQIIEVGNLQISTLYLYENTVSPKDGYLLNLEDVAQIKLVMDDFQSDCDRWIEQVKESCLEDLKKCQEDAENRMTVCHNERDKLRLNVLDLKKEIKQKENKLLLWTIGGSATGILLGVITTLIIK